MMELWEVKIFNDEEANWNVRQQASLNFHETFRALAQLTSLELINADCVSYLPEEAESLTNLRFASHLLGYNVPFCPNARSPAHSAANFALILQICSETISRMMSFGR